MRTVRSRVVSSSLPSISSVSSAPRIAIFRTLSVHSKNGQKKIFVNGGSAPEKPPSSNRANMGTPSRVPYISDSHITNYDHYTNSFAKPKTPRTGPLSGRQKSITEQIRCPDLQATIFVPGTVGSLINLLAIVREAKRRYGPISEYRCPTVVSTALVYSSILPDFSCCFVLLYLGVSFYPLAFIWVPACWS